MMFSIEAEQAVIGCLLLDPEKLTDVLELINHHDFYSAKNRNIFYCIHNLGSLNFEIDAITVSESLNQGGLLDECGGFQYIVSLAEQTASTANVLSYAKLVGEKSLLRKIIKSCTDIISAVESGSFLTNEVVEYAKQQIDFLSGGINSEQIETFRSLLKLRIAALDDRRNGGKAQGMLTGFAALDERFNGIDPGLLWILGARPGMGKTTLALNIVENVASEGGEVLIFSLEMEKEQLVDKIICAAARLPYQAIRSGDIKEGQWTQLENGVHKLIKKQIHIIDKPGIEISHAVNIAKKYAKLGKLKLIVVDYLQLLKCKSNTRFDEVSEISRQLKVMAKECKCPVIALSQLNRSCESRPNKRPNNSDLRESGQIEQDADIISFIYRDEVYNPDTNQKGIAEIITTKWRFGETGIDGLASKLHESRFEDLEFKYNYIEQKPSGNGWD